MEGQIGIIVMLLTGISLAMDAFAVSISCGLSCQNIENALPVASKTSISFGFFQGMMILLGWGFGLSFKSYITAYDHWVAFILLALIGGKMIHDALEDSACPITLGSNRMLISLSIATSVDALAVGVSFSVLNTTLINILMASLVVAVVTFVFCFCGAYIGAGLGCNSKIKRKIDMTGGLILIALGLKILLEHTILL